MRIPWLLLLTVVVLAFEQGLGAAWPSVQPFTVRVPVDFNSERIAIDIPIRSSVGSVVYYFACRGGSEAYLGSLPGIWVGPLMCTLAEGKQATEDSLLSEDDSAAWFSRGESGPIPTRGTSRRLCQVSRIWYSPFVSPPRVSTDSRCAERPG